ncbi:MucR family transcriptional regulator [Histidinibacterium aquaticum]|uniref:MucR family transcriptional regulator n=1 Tax=Histidinibacterium aquaticum TaxID=2613962 RepID=A0A5J5GIF0_9RHOB|nr:hypothetical protein F3S47_09850 [Histidinibacterium aquaticum]
MKPQGQDRSSAFLVCRECGEKLHLLSRHLKLRHGLTLDDYRRKHSIAHGLQTRSRAYETLRQTAAIPRRA